MKFSYLRPASVPEALELLSRYSGRAKVLAGGTDLLVQLRDEDRKLAGLEYVVDISFLKELEYVREEGDFISLGPLTTHGRLVRDPLVARWAPFLAVAAGQVGSPQIRGRGTVGGNIVNASPAADTVPVLAALDAVLTVRGAAGARQVPIADAFAGPYRSALAPDELLVDIRFRKLPDPGRTAFLKIARRKALAIARLNVAVALHLGPKREVLDARISPGSVMPRPGRIRPAEEALLGQVLSDGVIELAARRVSEEMIKASGVRWSTPYKGPVVEVITRRALQEAGK